MADNIVIKGLEQLQGKFEKLANLKDGLVKTTDKAVKFVWGEIPPYPPKPALSTYDRTGQTGRAMYSEVRELGNEVAGVIGNNMAHAPWVISAEKIGDRGPQAGFHTAHGWYTLQNIVNKAKNGVIQIYRDWVKGMIE